MYLEKIYFMKKIISSVIAILLGSTAFASNQPITEGYFANWSGAQLGTTNVQNINVLLYAFAMMDSQGNLRFTAPNNDIGTLLSWPQSSNTPYYLSEGNVETLWKSVGQASVTLNSPNQDPDSGAPIFPSSFVTPVTGGYFAQICNMKQIYPNLQVILSVGGWTLSQNFSNVAANLTSTNNFVAQATDLLKNVNCQAVTGQNISVFNGIDIDWEYPGSAGAGNPYSPYDGQNYANLLKSLRSSFNNAGLNSALITFAGAHGSNQTDGGSINNYDIKDMLATDSNGNPLAANWVNMMAYDFSNGLPDSAFNAPLYTSALAGNLGPAYQENINQGVQAYISAGAKPSQIILGTPAYSKAWLTSSTQPYTSYTQAVANAPAYNNLPAAAYGSATPDDNAAESYYATNGTLYVFDSPANIAAKGNYVLSNNLGGLMFWTLDNDISYNTANYEQLSLTYQAYNTLNKGASPANAPQDAGSIVVTNNGSSWSNILIESGSKVVAAAALAPYGSTTSPDSVVYHAPYGQSSPNLTVLFENSAAGSPFYAPCNTGNVQLAPGQQASIYGLQSPGSQQATCSTQPLPTAQPMYIQVDNNDASNNVAITLVTSSGGYYPLPQGVQYIPAGQQKVMFCNQQEYASDPSLCSTSTTSSLDTIGNQTVKVLLTPANGGAQFMCPGSLNLSSWGYHHIMMNYSGQACALN
jgi:GH18 family chitinase